jgi:hypothetical protein
VTHSYSRRLASYAVVVGVVCAGAPALAAPAFAAQPTSSRTITWGGQWLDQVTRHQEVVFAESHWAWTAWNDSTAVTDGADQPNYQCAEFVARAMAAAGLIPGLSPDAPQNDYFNYTAPNGKVYDLLLISVLPQYNNIYAYLMDSGLGIDVGDDPAAARPGDFVVTYLAPDGTSSHMGLIVTPQDSSGGVTVDAHNRARLHYAYSFYEPSHVVELAPNARAKAAAWAATATAAFGPNVNARGKASGSHSRVVAPAIGLFDPAGPQV